MHPLTFRPIYRNYLWGGRRFATALGRELPGEGLFAESWELVDHGRDQSLVAWGELEGTSLGDLVRTRGEELLGRHAGCPSFPLLFKFLDAAADLSVQVHPDDSRAARLSPPDRGKTEAWYVVDAEPGSRIYAGLRQGIDTAALRRGIETGTLANCLHAFEPRPGDCVFIPAGTLHAIGAGLLIAEIQQASDVTYRLFDWNRVGPDGKPRELHVEAGLEAVTRFTPVEPVEPRPATLAEGDGERSLLVSCDYFTLARLTAGPAGRFEVGGDDVPHFLAVLAGDATLPAWSMPPLGVGRCVLLPACLGKQVISTRPGSVLLEISLP